MACGAAENLPCLKTDVEPWVFAHDYAARSLCDHFRLLALDGCGLEGRPLATGAASLVGAVRSAAGLELGNGFHWNLKAKIDLFKLVIDATRIHAVHLKVVIFLRESGEADLILVGNALGDRLA